MNVRPEYELTESVRFPNDSPDIREVGLEFEITYWSEMRSAMRRGMTRAFWCYALVKFYAALPHPPEKLKGKQKQDWRYIIAQEWIDANPDLAPLFKQYWDIRNDQVAHRGFWDAPKGAIPGRYIVTMTDGTKHDLNFNLADPDLNFDPGPDEVRDLENLIGNALGWCLVEHAKLGAQA